ncbi:MAG: RidA family protein [Fimbriimonadaceae bacterium]|nr:RidA family protein [Alphaproteobacteria bacterium]
MPNEMILPDGWPRPKGYSQAVAGEGRTIYVAGQIGWNKDEVFVSDDFVDQIAQSFRNIRDILAAAGAVPEHLVRLTWYVTDKQEYLSSLKETGAAYRSIFGATFPAMAVVEVSALMEDRAKVEIEATAIVPA